MYAPHDCSRYCCTLSTSEFKHHLSILAIKRRLYRKLIRLVFIQQLSHSRKDIGEFFERILDLAQIKDAHVDIMRAFEINRNDPVTKNIGSGINSKYDFLIFQKILHFVQNDRMTSQCSRILYMDEEPQESRCGQPSGCSRGGLQPRVEARASCR